MLKAGQKRRRNKAEMVEYRQEQESREEAITDKNERIRELEMEVARKSQAMQTKEQEVNLTKTKLFQAESKAEKNEKADNILEQMIDAGHVTIEADGSVTVNAVENQQHIMGNIKDY